MTSPERAPAWLHALLAACGGFLLSTLWFDLMFDVQVVGHAGPTLPDPVLDSIAAYYRRVTTEADPMQRLIAAVMLTTVGGALAALRDRRSRWLRWTALVASAAPIALAATRIFPDAVRLGTRTDPPADQSALARGIFTSHVACLASIAVFTAVQIWLSRRSSGRSD